MDRKPAWWRGARGEWWVAAQVALMLLVFFGPRAAPGLPPWLAATAVVTRAIGAVLMLSGFLLLLAALLRLGPGLTPLPYPREGGVLIQAGPFGVVRHPMYCGGVGIALGWALVVQGWLTLLYAAVLVVFLDFKADREERWLVEAYPDYPAYQRRVRKLIPFIR